MKNKTAAALSLFAILISTGCKSTSITIERPDGTVAKFTDRRAIMSTKAETEAEYDAANRKFTFKARVASSAQSELIEAAARGVAAGLSGREVAPAVVEVGTSEPVTPPEE
jgi:hypothetical protein